MNLFFRSLDRLKLTFDQLIIKLKPLFSCKVAENAMKRSFLYSQCVNSGILLCYIGLRFMCVFMLGDYMYVMLYTYVDDTDSIDVFRIMDF